MIKFKNVPGVGQIDLYEVLKDEYKDRVKSERTALFFASPWGLSSKSYAEMLGFLRKELNSMEKREFLEVFVVPAEANENDNLELI